MADLFGNNEKIRTIGLYQPFCTAMLHGKVETRWIRKGKKPPFPLGQYVFYSTQKPCTEQNLNDWCGTGDIQEHLMNAVKFDASVNANGYAIATGRLVNIAPMQIDQEFDCYVKFTGEKKRKDKNGVMQTYVQTCLYFVDVKPIAPIIKWKHGKQGVGFVPAEELPNIKS